MQIYNFTKQAEEDRHFYADQIPEAWEQMIAATRVFGLTLVSSRFDLSAREWRQLVTDNCTFDLAVACRAIRFAQVQQIPGTVECAGRYCFSELIHLEEPIFRYGLDHGILQATCSPFELTALKKQFEMNNQ